MSLKQVCQRIIGCFKCQRLSTDFLQDIDHEQTKRLIIFNHNDYTGDWQ